MIYYIAEIGLGHDGSLGIAHSYIDALSKTGINAIKFQMHLAEHESSELEKFRVNFSYEDKSRFDYWNRTSFNLEQWIGLKRHCEELNLDFLGCYTYLKLPYDILLDKYYHHSYHLNLLQIYISQI